jgi:hypothetical protein
VSDRSRKRPSDASQFGNLIVDLAIGAADETSDDEGKKPAAVALGRKGGLQSRSARAESMTSE